VAEPLGDRSGVGAEGGILGEHRRDEVPELVREAVRAPRQGARVPGEDAVRAAASRERGDAGDHLVEHDPEGVDVGPARRRLLLDDLRRHVQGRAEHGGRGRVPRALGDAGDPEVGDLRNRAVAGVVQEDVGGLDVPVDDPVGVDRREAERDLPPEPRGLGRRQGAAGVEQAAHVSPADVLHDDAQRAALDHEVAHPHDVAVHHAQEDGSLLDEPADDLRVLGVLGPEELDRDPLAVVVAGPRPDRSHRAATDLGVEPVAAAEGASGHGTSFDRVGG
jgi:hypothetical protein